MPNNNTQTLQPAGIKIDDILYVLFRHKWKIIFFSVAGIITAGFMYFLTPPLYQSEAKFFIRYVQDAKSLGPPGSDAGRSPDSRGENVINSEAEILTSLDLASDVVTAVGGPEKVLPKDAKIRSTTAAAAFIQKNIIVEPPKKSSVIGITFQHPNPDMVQPILSALITSYYAKHVEVHKPSGVFDVFLDNQTLLLKNSLDDKEKALRLLKTKAGIISLDDTKKAYNDQISRLRQDLFQTETELAEQATSLNEMIKLLGGTTPHPDPSSVTSRVDNAEAPALAPLPSEKIAEYKRALGRLELLYRSEEELLSKFTEQHVSVRNIRESIKEAESAKKKLEEDNPRLAENMLVPSKGPSPVSSHSSDPTFDMFSAKAKIAALSAKVKVLTNQLARVSADVGSVDQVEDEIIDLQREKETEEAKYRYYSSKRDEAKVEANMSERKAPNIGEVQKPSPPAPVSSKLAKRMAAASAGGILLGIGLAVLIEFFLDQTVKRPGEIETRLKLPLYLSIPKIKQGKNHKVLTGPERKLLLNKPQESSAGGIADQVADQPDNGFSGIVPWGKDHDLRPFYETLRDRLVQFFEDRDLTHKPKLIAVTSCSRGAGVTTIAAALAGSLSETGDGNVLLVDMNLQNGAVHPFFKGEPIQGLEDLLENENRETALVRQNLYMVRGDNPDDRLPRILPRRFAGLLPKLKASDYDYIIFDMPSINQTSITPRLAGLMDAVVLVIESEKTDRNVTERAVGLLAASKASTITVLNKTRAYIPRRFHQSFEES